MLKLSVLGSLPEFIVDAASSDGIRVFCCACCPAEIPKTGLLNMIEFSMVNIDITNMAARAIAVEFTPLYL